MDTEQAMATTPTTKSRGASPRRSRRARAVALAVGALAGAATLLPAGEARAQEILLTGPLAGAPAVRKLRLYREERLEVAPAVSFTLLDEYQRTIVLGARVNYNFTDWLAAGAYVGYGGLLQLPTGLTEKTQKVNEARIQGDPAGTSADRRLTAVNMGPSFEDQLGGIDWILAPQITGVPFRGKLALFQSVHLDTDLYFFAGPAIIGVSERQDCKRGQCPNSFETTSRVQIAPTFGLGFTFYANEWNAIGFEWRGLPFPINTGGFDTHGGGADGEFPDDQVNADDREYRFNQMLTVSYNFYFPRLHRVSE